jgi:hypothetical protein
MARQANTEKMSWYMKNKLKKQGLLPVESVEPEVLETEEEIRAKLTERFDALNLIAAQTGR